MELKSDSVLMKGRAKECESAKVELDCGEEKTLQQTAPSASGINNSLNMLHKGRKLANIQAQKAQVNIEVEYLFH